MVWNQLFGTDQWTVHYQHTLTFQPYYFPALDATMDQRSLPMGYTFFGHEPDPGVLWSTRVCYPDPTQFARWNIKWIRARSLQQERPRQVYTPKFGNINQKHLEQTLPQSQPQREDRQAFPCLQAGCKKICKPLGGLALHVKWEHGAKTT